MPRPKQIKQDSEKPDRKKLKFARLEACVNSINEKYGKNTICKVSERPDLIVEKVPTGLPDLDKALNGGIPKGLITVIAGLYQAGKSSLCYLISSKFETVMYIDYEDRTFVDRVTLFNPDIDGFYLAKPDTAEDGFRIAFEAIENGVDLVVFDSIGAMVPQKVWEETDPGKQEVALRARLLSVQIPKLAGKLRKSGCTAIFINQARDIIGAMAFGDKTTMSGGHALLHGMSTYIRLARKEWIDDGDKTKIGQITKAQVKKNVGSPERSSELPLLFDVGWVSYEELEEVKQKAKEARKAARKKLKEKKHKKDIDEPEEDNDEETDEEE